MADQKTEIVEAQPAEVQVSPSGSQALVNQLAAIVMDPRVPMDRIERLWEMKKEEDARIALMEFNHAISDARSEIKPIIKTGDVGYDSKKTGERTSYKHETLDGIASQVDPILSRYGLSYRFRSEETDTKLTVTCVVSHRGGYSEETSLSGPPDTSGQKNAYQAKGSAATYLQRYTLKLALGLSAAKDTDTADQNQDEVETLTEDQFRELKSLMDQAGLEEEKLLKAFRAKEGATLIDLPSKWFDDAKKKIIAYGEKKGVVFEDEEIPQ